MADNLEIYNQSREVPKAAQKTIKGGRLSGMTDINPMWRIKKLTELFGPAGFGWRYEIIDKRLEQGANDEIAAFIDINLFVKYDGEWSDPIQGTGGSTFVANERKGLYTSDECFKMALTDAISIACKALGFGADIYWDKDNTKYDKPKPNKKPNNQKKKEPKSKRVKRIKEIQKLYKEKNYKPNESTNKMISKEVTSLTDGGKLEDLTDDQFEMVLALIEQHIEAERALSDEV